MTYVELHAHSAYSFLDGASQPEELAARAAELGYEALALTDHDGVYGSLEFAHAAKHLGVRPITGAEVTLADESHVTLLVESARGYANLCRLLTAAHAHTRDTTNREPLPPRLDQALLEELNEGLVCLSGCARDGLAVRDPNAAARLARAFGRDRFYVELQRPYERGDARRNAHLRDLAASLGVRTVATGDVHAHDRRRAALQDVLVAVRCRTSLEGCERERRGNHESVLLPPEEMRDRFGDDLDAVAQTTELARRLEFDLTEELGYRYPDFSDGEEPAIVQLRRVCEAAFAERYSNLNGHKRRVRRRLEEELALIDELGLAGFFLLHWEVLELAREVALEVRGPGSMRHVLPPGRGRGSSVGSLVCYLTGLSHVDPVANNLSLGRFLNRELASVPDIDLDFPRDIREKLIVRVVERYGQEHASLVAAFATYRSRGAIRDVGKALGLPYADLERLARLTDGWNAQRVADEIAALPDAATKLRSPRWRAFGALCAEIAGLPRHISQHPGGMVISSRPLVELVPVQPAAMEGRQMCQWDKDSCADAGFLKIDLLGLGMLSAVEECVDLVARHRGERIDLSRVPLDDPDVFEEIQRADTIGCFQIESRAQMQTILRTRPENLDDITIQVALVRPGPIQGKAVHPYIEHRQKLREDPNYEPPVDHELLREPLRETLGVVVFQDQVLDVAIHLAGFSVGEAEGLRRAMSRKRSHAALESYRSRFVAGAGEKGVDEGLAAPGVRQARRLLGLRLSEVALGRIRVARVPVGVAAAPLRTGVPRLAPQCAADGLLSAGDARPRRTEARGRDAPAGREPQRGGLHDRGRRCSCRLEVRDRAGGGRRGGRRREAARIPRSASSHSGQGCRRTSCARSPRAAPATPSACAAVSSCGSSGSCPAPQACPARAGRGSSSRCRSSRRSRRRSCPSRRCGSGCSPTTGRRACPSASTRSSCSARTCRAERSPASSFVVFDTGKTSSSQGWWSRGSVRQPRTVSSSCSSRTSSRRSTSSSCRRCTSGSARSCAASRSCSSVDATSTRTATGTSSWTSSSHSRRSRGR